MGQAFSFVQGQLPGEGVELLAAGARWVRFDLAWAEQDTDAFSAELVYCPEEGEAAGERGVNERQHHHRDRQAHCLSQDPERIGVANALGEAVVTRSRTTW